MTIVRQCSDGTQYQKKRGPRSGEAALLYTSPQEVLLKSGTQDVLVRPTTRAAPGKLAVNDDGRNTSHAVLLRLGSHVGLLHIVDHYLMRRPGKALNYLDCFFARRTPCAENFNSLSCSHSVSPSFE